MYGNFLVVQWLGPGAFTAMAHFQSLVGELKNKKQTKVQSVVKKNYMLFLLFTVLTQKLNIVPRLFKLDNIFYILSRHNPSVLPNSISYDYYLK